MNSNKIKTLLFYLSDDIAETSIALMANQRNKEHAMYKHREQECAYELLITRHLVCNEVKFHQYFRLTPYLFDYVLGFIRIDLLLPPSNRVQKPITPEQKLCLVLRFMATGESHRSLAFQFRISPGYMSLIVQQVLLAIVNRLQNIVMPAPTEETFSAIAKRYNTKWNFPNCVGSVDGKHVRIKKPLDLRSTITSNFVSIVLIAIVDADYQFIAIDVGAFGREGDSSVFKKSNFGQAIERGSFNIPPPATIPGTNIQLPHVLLGDQAFPLSTYLMKPFSQAVAAADERKANYNYRLSRARRTVENAFGIMSQYWRIFFTPIAVLPKTVDHVIIASCLLHNLLRANNVMYSGEADRSATVIGPALQPLNAANHSGRTGLNAQRVRDEFIEYFASPRGRIPWRQVD